MKWMHHFFRAGIFFSFLITFVGISPKLMADPAGEALSAPPMTLPLLAAAQINAYGGGTPGIDFMSNFGFVNATRSWYGVYELTLANPPSHNEEIVVNVTRNNSGPGGIQANVLSNGHIQINNFDLNNDFADTQFFITVFRAPIVNP